MQAHAHRLGARRAGGHVERQQVLVGGVHQHRVRRLLAVVGQRGPVRLGAALGKPVAEGCTLRNLGRQQCRHRAAAEQHAQVVGDAAAAVHQHALLRQRRQCLAQRQQPGRAPVRRKRQRQHRDVGLGPDEAQRRPDAVVQPAFVGHMHRQAGGLQQAGHLLRQRRRAGRVVAQAVQRLGEAAEVVHRGVLRGRHQQRLARQRVGRDGQDGARAGAGVERGAQPLPERADLARLQRRHRRAVGQEDRGQGEGGGVHGVHYSSAAGRRGSPPLHAGFKPAGGGGPLLRCRKRVQRLVYRARHAHPCLEHLGGRPGLAPGLA